MKRKSSRSLWTAKLTGKAVAAATPPLSPDRRTRFQGTVLGIDPSLRGTGLAVVRFNGIAEARLLHSMTVRSPRTAAMPECLGNIARCVSETLDAWEIDCVVLEQTIYVQNFQTAQILGAARGAAIAPAAMRSCPVYEYAPLRIKQAVVGFGRASKAQVAGMMRQQLGMSACLPTDEADAAAAAYCHALCQGA